MRQVFGDHQRPSAGGRSAGPWAGSAPTEEWPASYPREEVTRRSRALEEFLARLREQPACRILDLGVNNQQNLDYLTTLGHSFSAADLLYSLDAIWLDPNRSESQKIDEFLEHTLNYQECSFGAVLVWDALQHLPGPLLEAVVARLQQLVVSGAHLLAFFPADERARVIPTYSYRIVDGRTLQVSPGALRPRENRLNNRGIERLFQAFAAVKFYLTRDHLRELLVRR